MLVEKSKALVLGTSHLEGAGLNLAPVIACRKGGRSTFLN